MAFRLIKNIWANLRQLADRNIWDMADPGDPVNAVTGAGFAGVGSFYTNTTNGAKFVNTGTQASPVWTSVGTITAGSVTLADLDTGIAPFAVVKFAGTAVMTTNMATASITVTGAATTDLVHIMPRVAGETLAYITASTVTTNAVTYAMNTSAGAGGVVQYSVLRAAV